MQASLRAAALLVVFVAFVIRVYHLDAVGLEGDEAFSIRAAYSGFSYIMETATSIEPHPPLHYSFLRLWYMVAGTSEFSLRFPSVLASVLTVVFLFKLAGVFSWRAVGLFAAILLALGPYQIWYSQDVRMYTPVALFGLVAIYFSLRALWQNSIRHLSLYVVCMLLALYTHYFAVFLFIFANLVVFAGMWNKRTSRSAFAHWVGAQLVIVALYIPWLAVASRVSLSYAPNAPGSVDLLGMVRESIVLYSLGYSSPSEVSFPLALGFLVIGIAGLWSASRTGLGFPSWFRVSFVSGYALLPLALGLLVSLLRPMFAPRYLMVSAPAFYLVLGLGVAGLTRRARPLGLAAGLFLVAAQMFSLGNYFLDYRFVKTDLPDGVKYVLKHTRPGDAIVLDGWGQPLAFWYYNTLRAEKPAPSYLFPLSVPIEAESTFHNLDEIMAQHQGVWLLDYGVLAYDPQRLVETYLARNYYQAVFRRAGRNRVVYYASALSKESLVTPLNVGFDGEVVLTSFSIDATSARPGEILRMALSWHALTQTRKEYTVSWRLLDRDGRTVFQRDAGPASGFSPSTEWAPGAVVSDRYGLPLPVSFPPGRYALTIVVYDKASGAVLEPRENDLSVPGNVIPLAHIDVIDAPPVPPLEEPNPSHRTSFAFGGLRLLGFDLDGGPFRPGQSMAVKLYWEATDDVDQREVVMRLLSDKGQVLQEKKTQLGTGWFSGGLWPRGRIAASYVDVSVPARALSGSYTLSLSLRADGVGESAFSAFPKVSVVSRERTFTVPSVQYPRDANFGGLVALLGYDLQPAPSQAVQGGQTLRLTLYWRALREMAESYKVFTHLVGEDGRIYGQEDGIPLAGKAPTSGWAEGEIVTDQYDIAVRPDAPPGTYKLVLGLYEPAKGARLALSDGSGDSYVLADLVVSAPRR